MASGFGSDDDFISGINITPLVDVILVLLIIFLITAPVLYPSAIQVHLPQAKSGESAQPSPLTFSLGKDGTLTWNKDRIDWNMLNERLKALKDKSPDQIAVLNADEATPHGTVIRLIDTLRESGFSRFSLNVESPKRFLTGP